MTTTPIADTILNEVPPASSEATASIEAPVQAQTWTKEGVTIANAVVQENSTEVENAFSIDAVKAELAEMRKLYAKHDGENSDERKALNQTSQERQITFLTRGIVQARLLMRADHEPVLRELVEGRSDQALTGIGETLGVTDSKRLRQIARLQIGYRSEKGKTKGAWIVPARRDERIAQFYGIIIEKGWKAEELSKKFADAKGATKLLADHPVRVTHSDAAVKLRQMKIVARDESAPLIPVSNIPSGIDGQFRLAIVSVHDGSIKYHSLAPVADSVRDRTINDFVTKRYELLETERLLREEIEADDAAEALAVMPQV